MARRAIAVFALLAVTTLVPDAGAARRPAEPGAAASTLVSCAPGNPAKAPFGGGSCPGVRPGALMNSVGGDCTFGFVYAGSDGRRYVATAGHCGLTADGEQAWPLSRTGVAPASAPVVRDGKDAVVGRFAYAIRQGDLDFGLVRLDKNAAANPQACYFGGPTATNSEINEDLVELRHVGQGLGSTIAARTAEAPFGLYRPDIAYAWGAAWYGDSGGPVFDTNGRAVGVVTHLVASGLGDIRLNRLAPHLAKAQKLLRVGFTLQVAPEL